VIEVFQHAEPIYGGQIRVRLCLSDCGRDLNGNLLEANCRLKSRLIGWVEPVHHRLLVLFHAANARQVGLELAIHTSTGMAETKRLRFNAIHEDHAYPCERVVIQFAVRRTRHLSPRERLFFKRNALFFRDVQAHRYLPCALGEVAAREFAHCIGRAGSCVCDSYRGVTAECREICVSVRFFRTTATRTPHDLAP
jgi:hypothetical protein